MKLTSKILCLILIFLVSCKPGNENRIKTVSVVKKSEISDSASVLKKEADNYLLDNTANQDNGPVYMYCEKMPEFPGGEKSFFDYIRKNVNYPKLAVSDKIEGRVVIKFIVRATGETGDVQLIRSIRKDMDNECIRVINGMPKWKPGMINDKPVSVSYSVPVRFLLNSAENLNGIYILPSKK